jgi:hypothetical protein
MQIDSEIIDKSLPTLCIISLRPALLFPFNEQSADLIRLPCIAKFCNMKDNNIQ